MRKTFGTAWRESVRISGKPSESGQEFWNTVRISRDLSEIRIPTVFLSIPPLMLRGFQGDIIYNKFKCISASQNIDISAEALLQYIPRNMHTVFALLCFVVVIHWLIFPYPSVLLHWHCGNLTIAPVPAKQPWWIWINTSCEFIMNDCVTTTKHSTTKPCAYFLGYTVSGASFTNMDELKWQHGYVITCPIKCVMKLPTHSQTSVAAPLRFGNMISSHTL